MKEKQKDQKNITFVAYFIKIHQNCLWVEEIYLKLERFKKAGLCPIVLNRILELGCLVVRSPFPRRKELKRVSSSCCFLLMFFSLEPQSITACFNLLGVKFCHFVKASLPSYLIRQLWSVSLATCQI